MYAGNVGWRRRVRHGSDQRRTGDKPVILIGFQRAYDHRYHDGASNQVHTGPSFPSTLTVPVMPAAS